MKSPRNRIAGALLAGMAVAQSGFPQQVTGEGQYRLPPQSIVDILDAPAAPLVQLSPNRQWLSTAERYAEEQTIAELAEPTLTLAGRRFKQYPDGWIKRTGITRLTLTSLEKGIERILLPPATGYINEFAWARASKSGGELAYTVVDAGVMSLQWYDAGTGTHRVVSAPGVGGKIADLNFTVDGRYLAFSAAQGPQQSLWIADTRAGTARRVMGVSLNHVSGIDCTWIKGGPPLICAATVADRKEPPAAETVPTGPIVQESYGRSAAVPTYQNLLKSPHDEALFDYYFSSQIVSVTPDGNVTLLGSPGVYLSVEPSPNGEYLLVASVRAPYSYQVPLPQFARRTAVWDRTGRQLKVIADTPLIENLPSARDAVEPGVRLIAWRQDVPATLMRVEALDDGDPRKAVPKRDRISLLPAPFTGAVVTFAETAMRLGEAVWAFPDLMFLTERSEVTARTRTWVINPSKPGATRRLWDFSSEDIYSDPGHIVMVEHPSEPRQIPLRSSDGRSLFLDGLGAAASGARPFVDRLDLATLKSERLWQSSPPNYETAVTVLDQRTARLLLTRESPRQRPNYFLYDVAGRKDLKQLTDLPDPAPWFATVKGELIRYRRDDGIELSATLYLPPGYEATRDGRLPFLLWAYPREFLTADGASQLSGSPFEFKRPAQQDHLLLLSQGYGVLDGPTMPIIAKNGGEPNDGYVEQLVASARAAVDTLVDKGLADRNRIGIAGHSYGAFMTVNLLAHSDLFRTGIAWSGAYNRTLTPFGFQAEPRTYWQAREVYTQMSPFTYADKIDEPVLLIHGINDANSGTFPIQSERLYAALKGNGGNVRYVQLPLEGHSYRARESRRHVLWEMTRWLDKYVKDAGAK